MAKQFSVAVRNAMLEAIETTVGTAPLLRVYSGSEPADCATAASGTKLLEIALPSDWEANASAGAKAKSGTWSSTGLAAGTAAYYRIYDAAGTTCHEQGTVGQGSGDLSLDNPVIAVGQTVTINTFAYTAGNA